MILISLSSPIRKFVRFVFRKDYFLGEQVPSSFVPVLLPSRGIFFFIFFKPCGAKDTKKDTSRGSGAVSHCIASIDVEVSS